MTDDQLPDDDWQPPRYVRWRWSREEVLVHGSRGAVARMWGWTVIKCVVVMGSWLFLWDHRTGDGWVNLVAASVVGLAVGLTTLDIARRALSYKRGFQAGRQSMYDSFFEAHHRGFSVGEWLDSELERDRARIFGGG